MIRGILYNLAKSERDFWQTVKADSSELYYDRKLESEDRRKPAARSRVEANRSALPEALGGPGHLATRQHAGALCGTLGGDVFYGVCFMVADCAAGDFDGRHHGPDLHYLS